MGNNKDKKEDLNQFFTQSELTGEELSQMYKALALQKHIDEIKTVDIEGGYKTVRRKIAGKNVKLGKTKYWLYLAACIVVLLLINSVVLIYNYVDSLQNKKPLYTEVVSAPGLVSKFELPDKSIVWLNSGSRLRFPSQFETSSRKVELVGEAFFDVETNKDSPFIVSTSSGFEIQAHGTSFNVNTTEQLVEAVLVEGELYATDIHTFNQKIRPDEGLVFDIRDRSYKLRKVDTDEKTAWKDGKIIFRNASLSEMFERLSRRYNVDIILHDENKLAQNYYSRVTFTNETIYQIFSYLQMAAPIEWKVTEPTQNTNSTLMKQKIDVWFK